MVARWYEHSLGFDLVARNLRVGRDELDLVLRRGSELRVVEVRSSARRTVDLLAWSVVGKKAGRLKRAALRLSREEMLGALEELHVDVALVLTPPGGATTIEIWMDALPLSEDGAIW
jgi:Holliday junction resolvase-like predicted endonuclease